MEGRFNDGVFALPVWGAYIWRGLFSEFYGSQQQETIIGQRGKNPVYTALGICEVTKLFLDQLKALINMESSFPDTFANF